MIPLALVTGGAGFIGSHLVDKLLAEGWRVRVFDNLSTGQESNLPRGVEFVRGCLTSFDEVKASMIDVTHVWHLGAMASVAKSLEDPISCHAVCATGTLHVLEAARQCGVTRVVYAASSSAYGTASDEAGLGEAILLDPLSPYAAAKLTGEMYCQAYAASFGLETVRLRFFNIFGPRQRADSPYSGVIAIFVDALREGRPITVHGDGLQVRDFVYVGNAVQALVKAGTTAGVSGQVFNVGTARGITIRGLVESLAKILGKVVSPIEGPPRAGDVRFSKAKIDAIVRGLGYTVDVSLEDGLKHLLASGAA